MSILVTYNGYVLLEDGREYKSVIKGHTVHFDSIMQFKQYIDKIVTR